MTNTRSVILEKTHSRVLKTFLTTPGLRFGDYVCFQKYKPHNESPYRYSISKPILCIYVGCFIADQTLGFNYVKWHNQAKGYAYIPNTEEHIEWDEYIDIIDVWGYRPNWKEILLAYRCQNSDNSISRDEIFWKKIFGQ